MNFNFSTTRLIKILAYLNIAFILMHLILFYLHHNFELTDFLYEIVRRFNMDREASIPTWYAQMILATLSLAFAYVTFFKFKAQDKFKNHWLAISLIALYMSIDEGSELHELATNPTQDLLDISSGPFFFAWIIPAMIVVLLISLIFLRFFLHLPKRTQFFIFSGAAVFIIGAVGVEMISGAYWQAQDFQYDMIYRSLNALEEGLENFGTIIAIYGILDYIKLSNINNLNIKIDS